MKKVFESRGQNTTWLWTDDMNYVIWLQIIIKEITKFYLI